MGAEDGRRTLPSMPWQERETNPRSLGLASSDTKALQDLRPWIEAHAPAVIDECYAQLQRFEEARRWLADPNELARLKALQTDCLLSMTAGVPNETYLAHRLALDQAYERAGVPVQCYLAACDVLVRGLVRRLLRDYRNRRARGVAAVNALMTAVHLDMQLALDAALTHRRAENERAYRPLDARLHQTLQASEAKYRSLVENIPLLIFRMDLHGRCTFVNHAVERLLGWEADALVQISRMRDLVGHPDDWPEAAVARALAGQVVQGIECRLRSREGAWRWCMLTVYPQRERDGHIIGIEGLVQDITEQKRATQEMARAERLTLAGQLASGLAHEVGTPLNVITGTAEYLLADLPPGDPRRADLEVINQETQRVADLVRRLLGLVRESGEPRALLDVHTLLDHTLRLVEYRFEKEKIAVVKRYAPHLPPIFGVRQQLEQVFLNLLVNAWHAMPHGGTITITTQAKARDAIIQIADTGCGIPEEHLGRLFEPFFTTKPPEQGTGLGLPVAHHLITAHQGR
ncbi:MAG: protoglobin domain-containing protein, partial [Candidatus Entotheonellia bacterium]